MLESIFQVCADCAIAHEHEGMGDFIIADYEPEFRDFTRCHECDSNLAGDYYTAVKFYDEEETK